MAHCIYKKTKNRISLTAQIQQTQDIHSCFYEHSNAQLMIVIIRMGPVSKQTYIKEVSLRFNFF